MKRLWLLILLAACTPASESSASAPERWATYYGSAAPPEAFDAFDLVVLDSEQHPPIAPLKARGKIVLGYLSLGEAESYRPYYREARQKKLLLMPNTQWEKHHIIDVRNPAWEQMVTDKLIPQILARGFDGIMLDTIDSPLWLESQDKKYSGMGESAVRLLASIRKSFPKAKIMLNRGFEILPEAAPYIDMSLAESVRADAPPKGGRAKLTDENQFATQVAVLKQAQLNNPALKVYTLDYWNMEDAGGVAALYQSQRALGFVPYVSTVDLQKIYPEP